MQNKMRHVPSMWKQKSDLHHLVAILLTCIFNNHYWIWIVKEFKLLEGVWRKLDWKILIYLVVLTVLVAVVQFII